MRNGGAVKSQVLRVAHQAGLHARPAARFVQAASAYASQVRVRNLTHSTAFVNAKSILSVLTLGVEQGHEIELQVEGTDEEQALAGLATLIRSNFES